MLLTSTILFCAVAVASTVLAPPAIVVSHAGSLSEITRFVALPPAIVAGHFTVDGATAKGWEMAEPGAPFSATDVPVPNAPGRRLVFAGCDATLCVLHYERGGIAHFYEILALQKTNAGWVAVWNARGPKPLANFAALRSLIEHPPSKGWDQQWVKGDF